MSGDLVDTMVYVGARGTLEVLPFGWVEAELTEQGKLIHKADLPTPDDNRLGAFHAPASNAPSTEREAAIAIYPKTGTARRRVLDYIGKSSGLGATDEECSLGLGMRLYTAAPRRNELLNDGWIRDSGRTRPTTTGTQAVVWVLTDRGRESWSES